MCHVSRHTLTSYSVLKSRFLCLKLGCQLNTPPAEHVLVMRKQCEILISV